MARGSAEPALVSDQAPAGLDPSGFDPARRRIDAAEFYRLRDAVAAAGFGRDLEWSEDVVPPTEPDEFAREAIFVICNSGMKFSVAERIFYQVEQALANGNSASSVFGHKGKCGAIDFIWKERERLLAEYLAAPDKLAFCESLPWIGPITKYHLAKNFGADVAKPDVHLKRLADREGCSAQVLCERLAAETGYRVPTVDVVLWRACALGIIRSRDRDASLAEDAKRLSGEAVAARAEGIAQILPDQSSPTIPKNIHHPPNRAKG